jgi:predicted Zn-dependent peptidase
MSTTFRTTRLKNGARIATASMPYMKTVTVGLWAGVGGRHENAKQSGMAHFIEHLLFKGTAKRNARQITEAIEGLGGYINAFTSEDHTCYYAKAGAQHLPRVCEVLSDMYLDSEFPAPEIERERDVIHERS